MSRHRLTGRGTQFPDAAAVVVAMLAVAGIVVMVFVATGCGVGQ